MAKTHRDENFPVASLFLAKKVRAEVLEFYHLARMADDIADSPALDSEDKHHRLNEISTSNPHLLDLLKAFHQDADKSRYESWGELMDYCCYSANPVGRFLLDVHGETNGKEESDALCSALQILNHLQDCQKDFREMNRIYLPKTFLGDGAEYENLLSQERCEPALRKVLDKCLEKTAPLLEKSLKLPGQIKSKRLRYQAKVTLLCGFALWSKLKKQDPLATRVELTKLDKFLIAYKGLYPL